MKSSPTSQHDHQPPHELDWDFANSDKRASLSSIHPYPAKFISELPRQLIEIYRPAEGTAIVDPFCGSGTTLVEAQRAGFNSCGVDLNPIACMISRVKTGPTPSIDDGEVEGIVQESYASSPDSMSHIPRIDHWFDEAIISRLSQIKSQIEKNPKARDFLGLVLSSIIVRVSRQDSDTRYAAIEKNTSPQDVDRLFIEAAKRALGHLRSRRPSDLEYSSDVINSNILSLKPGQLPRDIGLVVTSPPYPNAYEYWLYHKYRMYWLDHDPLEVKANEIGARAHYFKKNHATISDFEVQMASVLSLLKQNCIAGAKVCFVVGRSKIHGTIHDNAKIIESAGVGAGFAHLTTIERTMSESRKSFNLSHASIKKESIVVLETP